MDKFPDIIETLLQHKANLNDEREREKAQALEAIELKYAARAEQIEDLLIMAGYEELAPVEEAPEMTAEPVAENPVTERVEVVNGEIVYQG